MTQSINLKLLRTRIDTIDKEILCLLRQRFQLAQKAKIIKNKLCLKTKDRKREKEVLIKVQKRAKQLKLDNRFIIKIFKQIIEEAKRVQNE